MYEEMQDINDKTRKEGLAILARILAASIMHKYSQADKYSTTPNRLLDAGGIDNIKPKGNDELEGKP